MNVAIVSFVIIAAIALVIFVIIRNKKDRKDLVEKLNEDYPKPKNEDPANDSDSRV